MARDRRTRISPEEATALLRGLRGQETNAVSPRAIGVGDTVGRCNNDGTISIPYIGPDGRTIEQTFVPQGYNSALSETDKELTMRLAERAANPATPIHEIPVLYEWIDRIQRPVSHAVHPPNRSDYDSTAIFNISRRKYYSKLTLTAALVIAAGVAAGWVIRDMRSSSANSDPAAPLIVPQVAAPEEDCKVPKSKVPTELRKVPSEKNPAAILPIGDSLVLQGTWVAAGAVKLGTEKSSIHDVNNPADEKLAHSCNGLEITNRLGGLSTGQIVYVNCVESEAIYAMTLVGTARAKTEAVKFNTVKGKKQEVATVLALPDSMPCKAGAVFVATGRQPRIEKSLAKKLAKVEALREGREANWYDQNLLKAILGLRDWLMNRSIGRI